MGAMAKVGAAGVFIATLVCSGLYSLWHTEEPVQRAVCRTADAEGAESQTACEQRGCRWQDRRHDSQEGSSDGVCIAPKESTPGVVFVHLFEWSWPDVAVECEEVLGPKGYDAVQVSPAMEHISGPAWWTRYQPVSYKLVSRSGDEASFKDMVKRCNAAGVMVIADAVINHMAAGSGTGIAGSSYGQRAYPAAGYSQDDFHHNPNDKSKNCGVDNYRDKYNVQECDLVGLPDLCTGCASTKARIANYMRNISATGANVGFRIDAAKHQDADELHAVLEAAGNPWSFGEVISGKDEAVTPSMYTPFQMVTEFNFARQLAPNFKAQGKLQYLDTFGEGWGFMPSGKAITFMDNHDTQRGEAQLTYKDGDLYTLANVFMIATAYGYPKVMSSYDFSSHDQGPPSYPVNCGSGWVCEHRRSAIANMVAWRKVAAGSAVEKFQKGDGGNRIAFSRGGSAFVALNRDENAQWSATLQTGLPAGEYCNVIQSDDTTICPKVTVDSDGNAAVNVPKLSAVALHTGKRAAEAEVVI